MNILKWVGVTALSGFLISVTTPLWSYLARPLVVEPSLAHADAIVVLAAGIEPSGSLSSESLRRAVHGLQLFKRGFAPVILLSGPRGRSRAGRSEADARLDLALHWGVPADHIVVVSQGTTTWDETQAIASALSARRASTALLVTSSLHMKRARAVLERRGVTVLPAPSDDYLGVPRSPQQRFFLMLRVLEQGAAYLRYRAAGYI